jgi:hypothetical protein
LEEGEEVLLNPPLFTEAASSSFQDRAIPQVQPGAADANDTAAQPMLEGQPGEAPGRMGGRRGMRGGQGTPDFGNMTEEQRQQMMERFQQRRGGQGMPDFGNMTEEERQQMMERFQQRRGGRGGAGQGEMTDGMGPQSMRRPQGQRRGQDSQEGGLPDSGPTQ